jgi:hypothetical protein
MFESMDCYQTNDMNNKGRMLARFGATKGQKEKVDK